MKRRIEERICKGKREKEKIDRRKIALKERKGRDKTESSIFKPISINQIETLRIDNSSGRISGIPTHTISLRRKMKIFITSLGIMTHQMDINSPTTPLGRLQITDPA